MDDSPFHPCYPCQGDNPFALINPPSSAPRACARRLWEPSVRFTTRPGRKFTDTEAPLAGFYYRTSHPHDLRAGRPDRAPDRLGDFRPAS